MVKSMRSNKLKLFIHDIQYVNRNPKSIAPLDTLDDESTNPFLNVPIGTIYYRCRIVRDDKNDIGVEPNFDGYSSIGSFVPPVKKTKDLRASYRFIPYLYVASTDNLAITETRAEAGDWVSIADIEVKEDLTLFDLRQTKDGSDKRNVKDNFLIDLAELYSKPVLSTDDQIDYIPTQYIAEYIKNRDYDGIIYPSSLLAGKETNYNIVIFNYSKCQAIRSRLKQFEED